MEGRGSSVAGESAETGSGHQGKCMLGRGDRRCKVFEEGMRGQYLRQGEGQIGVGE